MLIDSNILIYRATKPDPLLDPILSRSDLAVASVTIIETLGYHLISADQHGWLTAAFQHARILPLDDAVVAKAVELRRVRKVGLGDAIIAATALIHDLPLVTRNVADFEHIAGLNLINPFAD
jgi:predicted nucleic acid-binding protein